MWRGIVGKAFSPSEFDTYCRKLRWKLWRPKFVVLHNTAVPTLAQRPNGFTIAHMQGLESYYRFTQRWSAGPHLFIDDRQIWIFTPLELPGVHSPSWNAESIGVEMLGDYSVESISIGRGLAVRRNAVAAIATLSDCLSLQSNSLRLHREDPKTTHRCPGANVSKEQFIHEVRNQILELRKERAA